MNKIQWSEKILDCNRRSTYLGIEGLNCLNWRGRGVILKRGLIGRTVCPLRYFAILTVGDTISQQYPSQKGISTTCCCQFLHQLHQSSCSLRKNQIRIAFPNQDIVKDFWLVMHCNVQQFNHPRRLRNVHVCLLQYVVVVKVWKETWIMLMGWKMKYPLIST